MKNIKTKNNSGMTIIEMMMAIAIFSIGMAGSILLFSNVWEKNSYVIETGRQTQDASWGLNKMVNCIRGAKQGDDGSYPIKLADENDLVVFCDYDKDGVTERINFYKINGNILVGMTKPTATLPKTYPTNNQQTNVLVSGIVDNSDSSVFEYFNKDYPFDISSNPMTVPAVIEDVRLVKIYLKMDSTVSQKSNNFQLQSFVTMRNLNDYNQIR